ncbi:HAD family hydrolase [Paucisalibacillus sp. EB02]|uniref:HAD family hydrolase n=1 Tax=Paucisalibacillus sp. EB02 TaxID=1347087 RepID=UPI0004AF01E8|nr:HAD family hydrolase [Paucisalibacillus sp. EB02]
MTKKWLTFDLDGTLMQNPFGKWVFPEIVSLIKKEMNEEADIMGLIIDEHERRMSQNRVLEAYDWDNIVEDLLFELGNSSLKIDIECLVHKHSVSPKVHLLEENIIESLKLLEGYSLAVATNGYLKYQLPVMKEIGLDSVFDEIITPEQTGYAKPNYKILNSLKKEELYGHVGDRIDHDIVMANKMGITSIFINRNLPFSTRSLPVDERNKDKAFLELCKEKWYKENSKRHVPFTEECIPDKVIYSIGELVVSLV